MSIPRELLGLPLLHPESGRTMSQAFVHGIVRGENLDPRFGLISSVGDGFRVKNNVRLTTTNVSKRFLKLLTDEKYLSTVNDILGGGGSWPILVGALDIALGFVSGGTGIAIGIMYTLATTAAEVARNDAPLRARLGDQIWQVEQIGRSGDNLVHVEYFILWDPFRKGYPSNFIMHEQRRRVTA